jgi:endonuclease III-like uncharacterized protein
MYLLSLKKIISLQNTELWMMARPSTLANQKTNDVARMLLKWLDSLY